ncbi:MAG: immunoglobulin domain-containing protein [Verrucomicrobia bacterium]|nr:immunoglobulin domain-containing protein [Verrucomicrobiota bacterium]
MTTDGTLTTLYSFSGGDDGAYPVASLTPGSDGNFYGTTYGGGSHGSGTVFQISPNGAFHTLYSFTGANDGANPTATLMQGSDGGFYGTTTYGGPCTNIANVLGDTGYGTVFRITSNGVFSTIYSFRGGNDGGNPCAGLIQGPSGVLYGTTAYGGLSTNAADSSGDIGFGTVFQTTTNGAFTTLYSFSGGDDGGNPHAGLILGGDGNLYGTTYAGGTNGYGSVFQIAKGAFNGLYAFTGLADGGNPHAGLIQGADGNLYGTTEYGGNSTDNVDSDGDVGYGTVFKISTNGVLKTEFSFTRIDAASAIAGLCQGSDGDFYGTASRGGGVAGCGSIFRLTIGSGPPIAPSPPVILSGPTNQIVVAGSNEILVANATGTPPLAYQWVFDGTNLPGARNSVLVISNVQSANAGRYSFIALNPYGSVTSAVATLSVILSFTNLHSFASLYYSSVLGAFTNSDGFGPRAALLLSGNTLYGTASQGGSAGNGTVFRVNRDGSGFTNLYSFTGSSGSFPNVTNSDGAYPVAGLILSGNTVYGTAESGGSSGIGAVFKVNSDGSGFANLHSFTGGSDGAYPVAGLTLSGSTLYGTTEFGGSSGVGTVFRLNSDGSGFTNLHSFTGGSDGAYPVAGLILSGNTLYGTAYDGGDSGAGTVFKVNTDGAGFTTVHSFNAGDYASNVGAYTNSDGAGPLAGLILSGNTLYGTASQGGSSGAGTVFAVSTSGTIFANLHNFTGGSEGALPAAGLVLSGSTLYGTAWEGGSLGYGTVFAVNSDGTGFTTLHRFTGYLSDGAYPMAGLILSGNTLFGTSESGGRSNYGTVFSLSLVSASPPQLAIISSGANVILTWPTNPAGVTLQSTTNLVASAVWSTVSPGPVVVNGQNTVTNVISGTQNYFRLVQ